MNQTAETISRRDFLKSFPQQLLKGIQSIAKPHLPITFERNEDEQAKTSCGPKKALLDITRCLAWEGLDCHLCYLACPLRDRAISTEDLKPVIHLSFCDGCALCVTACQTVNDMAAIKMVDATEYPRSKK